CRLPSASTMKSVARYADLRCGGMSVAIQPLTQLLAGPEERNELFGNSHGPAGARVAADPRGPLLHRERAEAAQLDAFAARQRVRDRVEDRRHDALDVSLIEMRVRIGQTQEQFGLGHMPDFSFFFGLREGPVQLSARAP